jgi:hypothetical protein
MTPEALRAVMQAHYPPNASCWSQATDEVRDLCRYAREDLGLPEDQAVDFRVLKTPEAWNTIGVNGLVAFYRQMTTRQQEAFVENNKWAWTR